jgi:predicted enzyme related to lactoylglutathione lyase
VKIKNRINTCFIHFKDLKKAKEWYKSVFPFEVDSEGDDYLSFKMEGTGLILLQAHNMDFQPLPYSVFFFETSDVDQAFHELTEKGVKTDGIKSYSDGMFGCNAFDLEGNMLLICTPLLSAR